MKLEGQVAIVTGAGRNIGEEIAKLFAAEGARVAVVELDRMRGERVVGEIGAAGGEAALFLADVSVAADVQRLVREVVARFGRIDILVNNAAIYADHPIASVSYEEWQQSWRATIDANLIGPSNVTFCAAQQMIGQGGGRIINISSRGAFRGEPTAPAYGASKAGLNAMSQSLAQALAPHNIFVYAVAPGFVDTERVAEKVQGAAGEAIRNQSPLRRVAHPDEVARTVLFLASEGTDFLTGGIIDVNGASYLRS